MTVVVPNIELNKIVKHSQHKDYGYVYNKGDRRWIESEEDEE